MPMNAAAFSMNALPNLAFSGAWVTSKLFDMAEKIHGMPRIAELNIIADGSEIEALDMSGAWVMHSVLNRLSTQGKTITYKGFKPEFAERLEIVAHEFNRHANASRDIKITPPSWLEQIGITATKALKEAKDLLSFVGEVSLMIVASIINPSRIRWRPILYNIREAGFNAIPIVGVLAFLLGVVVAYQSADQLRNYGANIFVVDLIGISMLREFAPLIAAVIIAGRSGSAYAAQIGTMSVTEEIDAMRVLGIVPMEMLVLPKLIGMVISLPLLTVWADMLGIFGGMLTAKTQLDVSFVDFIGRLVKAVEMTTYTVGLGKAFVFAIIITMIGCFQGFRTHGGADSVGRQTTRSVVQSIFLVIVADALFSVLFSILKI
ncbi:MAG: ABC transporter permease [Methylotenera sp.]|uniref:MlaE family ABC transporter permease n=1 Tax=Methylotenera sp. TaxID=2051956 RepID=UPI00248843DA|nr:ABC transporter permease [Methylotenera sp.]MDI1310495.1 ABC transporter permease [Methylotenera sp.]